VRYPVLTNTKCTEIAAQLVAGAEPSIEPHVKWVGRGAELDLRPIAQTAKEITEEARAWTDSDRDRFEGKVSTQLLGRLSHVPIEVLDDRGFWRFVSLRYFWEFIAWREEGPFSKGNYLKYVDASTNTESVLPRMYLRARAVGGPTHADVAAGVPNGTDFWRSHVLRVRTGSAAPVTRAFATKQAEDRLATDPLRQAARRLNRTWTNVVLHLYQEAEAAAVIETIWNEVEQ
jgi:hypothetical protein